MMSGLRAALAEASSPSWSRRARAGRDLASFAEVPEAAEALARLLLDAGDTAVTRQTAEALARVGTVAAVRLVAQAVAEADDNHADWLWTGVQDALDGPDGVPGIPAGVGPEGIDWAHLLTTKVVSAMSLYDIPLRTLSGEPTTLGAHQGAAVLVVNVASKCGLTPQYEGLERLQQRYAGRGFTVLGVPCNQFAGQEPGTAEEIETFCSTTYGVSFPLLEKTDVNGDQRHPLYAELTRTPDAAGEAGDVQWNFEKFLVSPQGDVVGRFRPRTEPEAAEVVAAIEAQLPG